MEPRTYRAICFDLDGTLLPMDLEEFSTAYFKSIAAFVGDHGLDPALFSKALKRGMGVMAGNAGNETNGDMFWHAFAEVYGEGAQAAHALADEYYAGDFTRIGSNVAPYPDLAQVLAGLAGKGYPLLLTTMPIFPRRAVEERLTWAGLDPAAFVRITDYDNSKAVKPRLSYFAENLAAMGLAGEDVLMVGNNTLEDLSFLELGADAYLITDYLIDPVGFDLGTVRHGTMADFCRWAATLPPCENPAHEVRTGEIPLEETLAALHGNARRPVDVARAAAEAAAAMEGIAGGAIAAAGNAEGN